MDSWRQTGKVSISSRGHARGAQQSACPITTMHASSTHPNLQRQASLWQLSLLLKLCLHTGSASYLPLLCQSCAKPGASVLANGWELRGSEHTAALLVPSGVPRSSRRARAMAESREHSPLVCSREPANYFYRTLYKVGARSSEKSTSA